MNAATRKRLSTRAGANGRGKGLMSRYEAGSG